MKNKYFTALTLYQEVDVRLSELEKARDKLKNSLNSYPKGNIHIIKNKGSLQYYIRNSTTEKNGSYISKKEKDKIKLYVQKRYNENVLKLIEQEIKGLKSLVKITDLSHIKIKELYSNNPDEIKSLITPFDISDEDYARQWSSIHYKKKELSESIPVFVTNNGERVRSKSELTIANALAKYKIPYKYECPLVLKNGVTVYPDFTVLCVRKRKIMYWEHRGMMDDRDYARHAVNRIKEYMKSGYYLGESLIITEETMSSPLSTDDINNTILKYFE